MTDAISDGYRATSERNRQGKMFLALYAHLADQSEANREVFLETLRRTDEFCKSSWGKFFTPVRMANLESHATEVWRELLVHLAEFDPLVFKLLKEISPFAKQLFCVVQPCGGHTILKGDSADFFERIIGQDHGLLTDEGDKYALLIETPLPPSEVYWMGQPGRIPAREQPAPERSNRWEPLTHEGLLRWYSIGG